MTDDPADDLAGRLLDAQVAWLLEQVSDERLAEVVARDVDDLLAVLAGRTVRDVADAAAVKRTARLIAERAVPGPLVGDLVGAFAETAYDLPTGGDQRLGDVVDRDAVQALVTQLLGMRQLHERLLDRLTESPLVATVASRFVTKIVGDFVAQNRARAERLPGMTSLLSAGTSAVSRVRGATDRHLDQLLGDAAGRGAAYALRRTNAALLELLRDSPVQGAVMEVWDLHADDPVAALREYLSRQELRDLALLVHGLVTSAQRSEYAGLVLDACVDTFFDRHGDRPVTGVLADLGLDRDALVATVQDHAPRVVEALRADGALETLLRARLEPFFGSPEVAGLLRR